MPRTSTTAAVVTQLRSPGAVLRGMSTETDAGRREREREREDTHARMDGWTDGPLCPCNTPTRSTRHSPPLHCQREKAPSTHENQRLSAESVSGRAAARHHRRTNALPVARAHAPTAQVVPVGHCDSDSNKDSSQLPGSLDWPKCMALAVFRRIIVCALSILNM